MLITPYEEGGLYVRQRFEVVCIHSRIKGGRALLPHSHLTVSGEATQHCEHQVTRSSRF